MKSEELLTHIKPEWHDAFLQFVETGEASNKFLEYLDRDDDAQNAVEIAFKTQAAAFEKLAGELRKTRDEVGMTKEAEVEVHVVDVLSAEVADAMEKISELPAEERTEVMHKTASALRASPKHAALRSAVQTLEKAL
jgi:hypothetical protein